MSFIVGFPIVVKYHWTAKTLPRPWPTRRLGLAQTPSSGIEVYPGGGYAAARFIIPAGTEQGGTASLSGVHAAHGQSARRNLAHT